MLKSLRYDSLPFAVIDDAWFLGPDIIDLSVFIYFPVALNNFSLSLSIDSRTCFGVKLPSIIS